jgi:hypothetical protein
VIYIARAPDEKEQGNLNYLLGSLEIMSFLHTDFGSTVKNMLNGVGRIIFADFMSDIEC